MTFYFTNLIHVLLLQSDSFSIFLTSIKTAIITIPHLLATTIMIALDAKSVVLSMDTENAITHIITEEFLNVSVIM